MTDVTKADLESMERFHEVVTELKKGPFADHVFTKQTGVTFTWNERGQAVDLRGPGRAETGDMILALRLVLQDNDGTSISQMYNIVRKFPDSPSRTKFLEWVVAIKRTLKAEAMGVVYDATTDPETGDPWMTRKWSNWDVLEHIIYGERAHKNPRMARVVKHVRANAMTSALLETAFQSAAGNLLKGLFGMQYHAAQVYEHHTGRKLPVWMRPGTQPKP
ncbi:MAG: hypothetical protein ACYC2H_12975 [Thermoplasmatota archaeon]